MPNHIGSVQRALSLSISVIEHNNKNREQWKTVSNCSARRFAWQTSSSGSFGVLAMWWFILNNEMDWNCKSDAERDGNIWMSSRCSSTISMRSERLNATRRSFVPFHFCFSFFFVFAVDDQVNGLMRNAFRCYQKHQKLINHLSSCPWERSWFHEMNFRSKIDDVRLCSRTTVWIVASELIISYFRDNLLLRGCSLNGNWELSNLSNESVTSG